jgi:hypothetical protein
VSVILAGFGASAGVKSKQATPTRNPAGRADWAASQARCDARSLNAIGVPDMRRGLWPRGRGVKPKFFHERRKLLWKRKATLL